MSMSEMLSRRALRLSLRTSFKFMSTLPLPVVLLRQVMEASAGLFKVRQDVLIEPCSLGDIQGERHTPHVLSGSKVLLHFHGGAFFAGSSKTHRGLGRVLTS